MLLLNNTASMPTNDSGIKLKTIIQFQLMCSHHGATEVIADFIKNVN